jgi:primase-polymerase (primpol)-like protein
MTGTYPTKDELPEMLTTRDQWLCWRAEERDGKMTKIPINPHSGAFASTTDATTWSSFEIAREQLKSSMIDTDGLGFVFTDSDPIVGVDLDKCRIPETDKTREWATKIIDQLESFTEISPSGTGYHVLLEGSLPEGRNRKDDLELYETARFFTVTGDHLKGTPKSIQPRDAELDAIYQEHLCQGTENDNAESGSKQRSTSQTTTTSLSDTDLLERAKDAANGEKFTRLWRGNTAGYDSHSEADMALCSLLAFWTGGNNSQIDQLFRDSGLMREKWDERHFADGSTYGEKTIERAVTGTTEFYEPPDDENTTNSNSHRNNTTEESSVDSREELHRIRERHADRLEQIGELEAELQRALDENEQLRDELESERQHRQELETELDAERKKSADTSWVPWG